MCESAGGREDKNGERQDIMDEKTLGGEEDRRHEQTGGGRGDGMHE
jgi:hypothetical protein